MTEFILYRGVSEFRIGILIILVVLVFSCGMWNRLELLFGLINDRPAVVIIYYSWKWPISFFYCSDCIFCTVLHRNLSHIKLSIRTIILDGYVYVGLLKKVFYFISLGWKSSNTQILWCHNFFNLNGSLHLIEILRCYTLLLWK